MIRRVIGLCLILLLAIGGYQSWTTGRERSRLQARYDHLVAMTGELSVTDASRLNIVAIPTGEPLHFAWRVYCPANFKLTYQDSAGMGGSTSISTAPQEMILRVRIREVDGVLLAFKRFNQSGGWSNLGDTALANVIRGHEHQILVEQFASKGGETLEQDGSAELIRLTLPADLQAEIKKRPEVYLKNFIPVLYQFRLGKPRPDANSAGK